MDAVDLFISSLSSNFWNPAREKGGRGAVSGAVGPYWDPGPNNVWPLDPELGMDGWI